MVATEGEGEEDNMEETQGFWLSLKVAYFSAVIHCSEIVIWLHLDAKGWGPGFSLFSQGDNKMVCRIVFDVSFSKSNVC